MHSDLCEHCNQPIHRLLAYGSAAPWVHDHNRVERCHDGTGTTHATPKQPDPAAGSSHEIVGQCLHCRQPIYVSLVGAKNTPGYYHESTFSRRCRPEDLRNCEATLMEVTETVTEETTTIELDGELLEAGPTLVINIYLGRSAD